MMSSTVRKILFVGMAIPGTGLTRVLSSLSLVLSDCYDIHYFGLTHQNSDVIAIDGITLHHCHEKIDSIETAKHLADVIQAIGPEIIFVHGQPWWAETLLKKAKEYTGRIPIFLYTPFEGKLSKDAPLNSLQYIDHLILYHDYSRKNIKALIDQSLPQLHVLPHGIDQKQFYPITKLQQPTDIKKNRWKARQLLFQKHSELHNSFIVLNANAPYYRKCIDVTIKGFAMFARNKPKNVYLYLHHHNIDAYKKDKLLSLAADEGIADRVLLNYLSESETPLSEQQLNLLYNSCDVGLNTAMGEGWGLVSFEHAATGAIQVLPSHSTFIENWQSVAEFIAIEKEEYFSPEYCTMYRPSAESLAAILERLYQDQQRLEHLSLKAYRHVTSQRYQWNNIAKQLENIFLEAGNKA